MKAIKAIATAFVVTCIFSTLFATALAQDPPTVIRGKLTAGEGPLKAGITSKGDLDIKGGDVVVWDYTDGQSVELNQAGDGIFSGNVLGRRYWSHALPGEGTKIDPDAALGFILALQPRVTGEGTRTIYGFRADEVREIAPGLVIEVATQDRPTVINESAIFASIPAAVGRQQTLINDLRKEINDLRKEINDLRKEKVKGRSATPELSVSPLP